MSTTDLSVTKRVATPDAVDDVAVDAATGRVWTWSTTQAFVDDSGQSTGTDSTSIHAYATSSFAIDGAVRVPTYTFDAAALDGQLWLATNDGLYVVTTAANGPVATKVISGMVFSVAVDAVRHRVLYGAQVSAPMGGANSLGSVAVHEIDAFTHAVIGVGRRAPDRQGVDRDRRRSDLGRWLRLRFHAPLVPPRRGVAATDSDDRTRRARTRPGCDRLARRFGGVGAVWRQRGPGLHRPAIRRFARAVARRPRSGRFRAGGCLRGQRRLARPVESVGRLHRLEAILRSPGCRWQRRYATLPRRRLPT